MNNKFFYKLKRYFSLDGYSVAPVHIQLFVLILVSFGIVAIFSLYYGSFEESYFAFMDPTAVPKGNVAIVILEILIGLVIASFVVSILSSALENFITEIKKGILPFKRSGHLVIINRNEKLFYILHELNIRYKDINEIKEVVIILANEDYVEHLVDELENYTNLSLFVKYGNLFDSETYEKFSLSKCENLTILNDEYFSDSFLNDNNTIKILSTIVQNKNIDFSKLNITVESNSSFFVDEIYSSIQKQYKMSKISWINSNELLGQMLTRSMIDVVYYKIYAEIFTFDGFELYVKDAKEFSFENESFNNLALLSDKALLLGYIRDGRVNLNNLSETILQTDQLIFIAEDEKKIIFENSTPTIVSETKQIDQPSEIVNKKICMLGDSLKVENLFEFLDTESQESFKQYTFDKYEDYLDKSFVDEIQKAQYDSVIVNLEEEESLRYMLMLVSRFGKDSSFVNSCISIITNPDSAKIINEITGASNVILSQRLSAQFISQLCFDSNLINIINELTTSDGAEFNILNTQEENLYAYDKNILKQHLMNNNMTYIGIVNQQNDVEINSENISDSKYIIVLSEGVN